MLHVVDDDLEALLLMTHLTHEEHRLLEESLALAHIVCLADVETRARHHLEEAEELLGVLLGDELGEELRVAFRGLLIEAVVFRLEGLEVRPEGVRVLCLELLDNRIGIQLVEFVFVLRLFVVEKEINRAGLVLGEELLEDLCCLAVQFVALDELEQLAGVLDIHEDVEGLRVVALVLEKKTECFAENPQVRLADMSTSGSIGAHLLVAGLDDVAKSSVRVEHVELLDRVLEKLDVGFEAAVEDKLEELRLDVRAVERAVDVVREVVREDFGLAAAVVHCNPLLPCRGGLIRGAEDLPKVAGGAAVLLLLDEVVEHHLADFLRHMALQRRAVLGELERLDELALAEKMVDVIVVVARGGLDD